MFLENIMEKMLEKSNSINDFVIMLGSGSALAKLDTGYIIRIDFFNHVDDYGDFYDSVNVTVFSKYANLMTIKIDFGDLFGRKTQFESDHFKTNEITDDEYALVGKEFDKIVKILC